ncbi:enoyl-CoA hydratase-related protein [Arsenophonus endosymbiont of Aleurodicus floccissimus]|uniref:enoyl-CoA hydratase-related protein n=1 Tax=Arsenophonus endosymbiont of Aleurodicus floccissimus TaxID=2152761 RepID=UPI001EE13633|nr:enoyl-CoA hydratase-related protein [Arsenophonus endosymbiont of Aleurodicus floccissimus]
MILQQAQAIVGFKGIIIISNKPGCFLAGADISMVSNCKTKEEATRLAMIGPKLFNLLENYPLPIVAAIDGVCLGGGLELALTCHVRICTLSDKTRLGLPEVQLGLILGSGGTQRLPRLIGLVNGLDLILTSRQLRSKQSLKLDLVDDIVPAEILLQTAINWIYKGRKGKTCLPLMLCLSEISYSR